MSIKRRFKALWGAPGLSGLFGIALFFWVLFGSGVHSRFAVFNDSDTCWLIQTGLWILQERALPLTNPLATGYPKLAQTPLVCYQWLFEALLGVFYQWAQLHGVALLVAILYALTYILLILWLHNRGFRGVPSILCAALLGILTLGGYAIARPVLITMLFTAALLWLWSLALPLRRYWLIFPLLFLLWANMHLGFTIGLIVLAALVIDQFRQTGEQRLLWLWGACFLATLLNPYGITLYEYLFRLGNSPFMNSNIYELMSPQFSRYPLTLATLILLIASALVSFRTPPIHRTDRVLFLSALVLGLYSVRHLFLLGMVSMPFVCAAVAQLGRTPGMARLKALGAAPFFRHLTFQGFNRQTEKPWLWLIVAILLGFPLAQHRVFPAFFPLEKQLSGAIAYLKQYPPSEPLLTNEVWGSYLIYFTPSRSYLDSRMDMYGDKRVQALHEALFLAKGWQQRYAQYKIKTVMLPTDSLQAEHLSKLYGWKTLYRDKTAIILQVNGL